MAQTPPPALVCGRAMTAGPENYFRAEFQGRVIYFCTEACLESFKADPERFYAAHSRSKNPQPPYNEGGGKNENA